MIELMIKWMQIEIWSPYVVGIGIGVLSWLTFLFSGKPVSCSSGISQTSGMIEKIFWGKNVIEKDYYKKHPPVVNWRWMFLVGIVIGAFLASKSSGSIGLKWVPSMWEQAFGESWVLRLAVAFPGGVLMGFAARWANGCTSGHGISGTMQLAVSSWVSVVFFFIGGIGMAMLIYRVLGA
jgi:uncharacterized protein